MSKIQKHHLARAAYIYVRQSTMTQVQHNLESQRRQYGLVDHARQLGWSEVKIIDDDLGRSGGGHVQREGFETVLAKVCQGEVGAVFALEASRLARNGQEWHRLLEFCAIVDTLIVDHDGVYDPKHPNDRLLLGMKGTMSELEISTFRQRSQEAIRQKARRGEYYNRIAEGYVLRDEGGLEKDSDEQVRSVLALVFAKFREMGSARQVYLWFRQEDVKLPSRREPMGKHVEFVAATPWLVIRILKDPIYAGAYAFGRSKRRVTLENGQKRVLRHRHVNPEDWEVLLKDHHEPYLSWPEYLKNQETLVHNRNQLGEAVRGSARRGKGLLAGLVRCGRCGKKMQVNYRGRSRRQSVVYYFCRASQYEQIGKQNCSIFGGVTVEQAVVEAVLNALNPVRMEAMIAATAQLDQKHAAKRQQIEFDLERARYEADRCQRQYQAVEPENRLVANTLESRWDKALAKVGQLQQQLANFEASQQHFSIDDREKLRHLACDLPRLWNHEAAPFDLKKRLLRSVIHEIVVYVDKKTLRVLIHWQGGQHTEIHLRKRKRGEHRWKTVESTLELIRQLARLMSDKQIAAQLNRMGITSSRGHTWTRIRVGNFRKANDIPNYAPGERQVRGELTIEQVAEKLGVSYSTVQRMIRRKQLPAHQICPGAPWIIRSKDLDNTTKKAPSSTSPLQGTLDFPKDI
jgi:excisionase family DNA binding protein